MSGHSKWATIKHKKGAADAKRGKVFTRLIKEITIAAKQGGGDPDGNPRLRTAILAAKAENMPADNIKRAIQRGTGELEGLSYEEIVYEGYGPGGVAIMVQVLTDNKNRAVSELRHAFSKNNGNLGESGSVGYLFSKKGLIIVDKSKVSEEKLTEIALDAGAEDLSDEGDTWEVITDPKDYDAVLAAIKAAGITPEHSEVTMIASTYQKLEGTQATAMMRLLETLEDLDDTQNVYTNFDMDEAAVAARGDRHFDPFTDASCEHLERVLGARVKGEKFEVILGRAAGEPAAFFLFGIQMSKKERSYRLRCMEQVFSVVVGIGIALGCLPGMAAAQSGSSTSSSPGAGGMNTLVTNPVSERAKPFEFGVHAQGGVGVTEDRGGYRFFMAGVHAGKVLTATQGPGIWHGNSSMGWSCSHCGSRIRRLRSGRTACTWRSPSVPR